MSLKAFAWVFALLPALFMNHVFAFSVQPDSGVVLLWQQKTAGWTAVKDTAVLAVQDSLYLDDQYTAKVKLGKGCDLYIRGELRANLAGTDSNVTFVLDQGSIFFKRETGAELANIKFLVRGCIFTPTGTCAAIKYTKQGQPTVAVLSGTMRIDPPKGNSIEVSAGRFGTYDPISASYTQGALQKESVTALESWSGTKMQTSATATVPTPMVEKPKSMPTDSSKKTSESKVNEQKTLSTAQPVVPAKTASALPLKQQEPKPVQNVSQSAPPATQTPKPQPVPVDKKEEPSKQVAENKTPKPETSANGTKGITWEISAGSVTVNGKQWTRIAISPDIPIWKFGVCLDLELFVNPEGEFSDKGWQFDKENALQSVLRKIRYIRFGQESDPVFVKLGGLSSVSLGYGFVVDKFTNMLHYPDQKLLGLQFNLTNISPLGITMQTMVADFNEFKNQGGIASARLAVSPLKLTGIPIVSDISIGATYGIDINEYAPAHEWSFSGRLWDVNNNGLIDREYAQRTMDSTDRYIIDKYKYPKGPYDTSSANSVDTTYRDSLSRYAVFGGDVGVPIIKTDALVLDLYGQAAVVADTMMFDKNRTGWGFGAPGVALRVGPLNASVEYRHVKGKFIPGYFGPYYLDERLRRYPAVETRSQSIANRELDGVFGRMGVNIVNVLLLDGTYQFLVGKNNEKDQRLEVSGGLGDVLVKRIPKLSKAELYFYKTDIGSTIMKIDARGIKTYDRFFEQTPTFYYGYRLGIAITEGAALIWDARFGFEWDANHNLVQNNNVGIQTAVSF